MDDCTQVVGTQDVYDPRRTGRNNSGLNDSDIADVLCILHPATPAAFRVVAHTAQRAPQYVLQNNSFTDHYGGGQDPEEAETFILGSDKPHAMDLALRLSAQLHRPELGFVFGRNVSYCDIILDGDTSRRISNLHFRIYINNQGVLMLEDASTNGTLVDDHILHGKPEGKKFPGPPQRMLISGSVIQIVSPKAEEIIKFILRIPHREGYEEQFNRNFSAFVSNCFAAQANAEARAQQEARAVGGKRLFPSAKLTPTSSTNMRAPVSNSNFGMRWSGGDVYSVVGVIGKGAFASVYQIATKTDGQLYAAKELDKRRCMKNGVFDRKITTEMQIMQTVKHPNIVDFVDYTEYDNWLYIIMEYVPAGDLQQYLNVHGALTEPVAKQMAFQVLSALDYLHQNKITHRDIKPDNILLADIDPNNFTIKLSDFGLSKVVQDDKETFLKTFCGTLLYCAPEVFPHYDNHVAGRSKKRQRGPGMPQPKTFHSYSQSVDIWSFAAVLWYSLCLNPPFEGVADNTGKGMFEKIMMTPLAPQMLAQKGVSEDVIDLLTHMLNTDPAARPTPAMCLQHKWFGGQGVPVVPRLDAGLGAIAEERETEAPDVASLSLVEQPVSQNSELSINSGDIQFFDPRQSKRFKSNVFEYKDDGVALDSSPEVVFDRIPIVDQATGQPVQSPAKLFGEISQSALNAQRLSVEQQDMTLSFDSDEEEQAIRNSQAQVQHTKQGTSLLGAESLVRDLKMGSPASSSKNSYIDSRDGLATPNASKNAGTDSSNDITPKAKPRARFDRRMNLAYPPSLYWDPLDPSTHTVEYASKVSGFDFTRNASITFPLPPLPVRTNGSATSGDDEAAAPPDTRSKAEAAWRSPSARRTDSPDKAVSSQPTAEDLKLALPDLPKDKPTLKLGKLWTTADSFMKIELTLSKKREDWGRAPTNTHIYPDGYDTRIAKRAIIIWFMANGLDRIDEDDAAWTLLPDLQACIMTEKRSGITVNGVHLPTNSAELHPIIKLYTGDEIEVFSRDGQAPLRFICDFYHGIGRQSRPQNVPTTLVRVTNDQRSQSPSWRSDRDQARPGSSWSG